MLAQITDDHAELLLRELRQHADDPIIGACRSCRRTLCHTFDGARATLAAAGRIDWDPLRDGGRR